MSTRRIMQIDDVKAQSAHFPPFRFPLFLLNFPRSAGYLSPDLFIYVFFFVLFSVGSNAPTSHSFRHHQHGLSRKNFEGVEDFTEANATSGKNQRLPDLIVKPKEEIYLNCTLPLATLENIGYGKWCHQQEIVWQEDEAIVVQQRFAPLLPSPSP